MIWKSIVRPLAIAPRRRFVATTLVYGLSLAVRFTSAAGEEVGDSGAVPTKDANPLVSIMTRNRSAQLALPDDWASPEVAAADCLSSRHLTVPASVGKAGCPAP